MQIEFFKHNIDDEARQAVLSVLETPYIAMGEVVGELETEFAKYLNTPYALALHTCTDALFLSLKALGIGPGDEVITTPLTFVATANSIVSVGAKPVFVDVDPDTGLIDFQEIEKHITPKTKAIIPVHLYGQMADMEALAIIAKKNSLFIIEDSAHCIEGNINRIQPGQLGDTACFSFFATKNITSGEGGMLITKSEAIYESCRMMRSHGQTLSADQRYKKTVLSWDVEIIGLNHKLTNFQAAMLLPQLRKIDALWKRRRDIYRRYQAAFSDAGIQIPKILNNCKSGLHLFTFWVDNKDRDQMQIALKEKGVHCTINYNPVHLLSFYRKNYGYRERDFPHAERIGGSTLSLPFYPRLKQEEIDYVIQTVIETVKGC
jgi:dTDP-4-amino-4,6-dideoxygalactose transaminase